MRITITEDTADEELDTVTVLPLVEKPAGHAYSTAGGVFAGNHRVAAHISLFDTDLCIHANNDYTFTIEPWSDEAVPPAHKRIESAKAWKKDGKTWFFLDFTAVYLDGVNRQLTVYVKPGYTAKVDSDKALVNLYKA